MILNFSGLLLKFVCQRQVGHTWALTLCINLIEIAVYNQPFMGYSTLHSGNGCFGFLGCIITEQHRLDRKVGIENQESYVGNAPKQI